MDKGYEERFSGKNELGFNQSLQMELGMNEKTQKWRISKLKSSLIEEVKK